METVALIASIVSIILAGFAVWQANHHRDQSDKLNRDTTEKLARIEACTTSTKEDAFEEVRKWGDFARAGGKVLEEAEKAKEEEMKKLKEEIQATTSAEISKVLQTVETKLGSSIQPSTISEIKKEFEELKKEIGKIQEKAVTDVKDVEKRSIISSLVNNLSSTENNILIAVAKKEGWAHVSNLEHLGHSIREIRCALSRVASYGLLEERGWKSLTQGLVINEFKLDKDLRKVLLQ